MDGPAPWSSLTRSALHLTAKWRLGWWTKGPVTWPVCTGMERFLRTLLNMALGAREGVLTAPSAHPRQVRATIRLTLLTPGRSSSLHKPTSYTAAIRNQPSRFHQRGGF